MVRFRYKRDSWYFIASYTDYLYDEIERYRSLCRTKERRLKIYREIKITMKEGIPVKTKMNSKVKMCSYIMRNFYSSPLIYIINILRVNL